MANFLKKFALIATSGERTEFAPELIEQVEKRLETMYERTKELIERARCNAQPNKSHRDSGQLFPSDEGTHDRQRYAAALREMASSVAITDPALVTYFKNLADVHDAIYKHQEKFYKQVQAYCIKELRKFTETVYPELKSAYSDMCKKRDHYDWARDRLKKCKADLVETKGEEAKTAQKEFENQATAMYELLQKWPEHEAALARAIHIFTRAETDLFKELHELIKKVPNPEKPPVPKSKASAKGK